MKKLHTKILISFVLLSLVFAFTTAVQAQNTPEPIKYVPLEQVPGLTVGSGETAYIDLAQYLPNLIKLAIGLAAALSVIYIIVGGFQYLSTDAISGKSEGKEKIQNALWGLALAIGSWVILNTINPALVNINLDIQPTAPLAAPSPGETIGGGPGDSCPRMQGGSTEPCICVDCVDGPIGVRFKSAGHKMNASLATKLQRAMEGFFLEGPTSADEPVPTKIPIEWWVTEAWAPRSAHQSRCHYNGACIDLNTIPGFTSGSTPTRVLAEKLNIIADELKSEGLSVVIFEVKTQQDMDRLTGVGVRRDFLRLNPGASESHFHIGL